MRAKVLIVGGGVMGASIAWHLAMRLDPHEEPVMLLEKSRLGAGSTGKSGAILRQQYSDRPLAAMARDSLRVYSNFERLTGRFIGFQRMGVLTLAGPRQPEQQELLVRNSLMQRELGIKVELLRGHEIERVAPGIAVEEGTLGAYEAEGGGADPVRTVEAFAALARERGATVRQGIEVLSILTRSGSVEGVETNFGPIQCETLVLAAGPWSRRLLQPLGVHVPLRVVRPEQSFLATPDHSKGAALEDPSLDPRLRLRPRELPAALHPVLLDLEHNAYSRCVTLEGRTRVGRLDYHEDEEIENPDLASETVSSEFCGWSREQLESRLPVYKGAEEAGTLAGMYTITPDAQALIGPWKHIEGLFLVTGFSGHGFKLAPSVGEGVAEMVTGHPVSAFDAPFFDPHRFENRSATECRAFGL
jgi:glycine/D-amino acid oxidase-like deaminating enzyme